jgi:hypothetical protein
MGTYLENTDEKLALQLDNFSSKIGGYVAIFGITEMEVTSLTEDSNYLSWAINSHLKIDTHKKDWTLFKNILKKGEDHVTANPAPASPRLEDEPRAVAPGVVYRFTTMVNRIKAHPNYTTSIGQNLGIEQSATPPLNRDTAQPVLKTVMRGGKVNLLWKKGKYSGILIEKDSGNGFATLDRDFVPDFIDNSPLPARGQSAIWMYRASYLVGDDKVGVWSDIVTITVAG